MKQNVHYFKIGVFVLLVLVILTGGLILLGAETWWGDVVLFETYLNESVQGLDVGSPVLQRGVNIGRIKEITFVAQAYPEQAGPGRPGFEQFGSRVMIVMEIDQKHFPSYEQDPEQFFDNLERLIASGFRIKLSYQGITGLAHLEGDFVDPARNPPLYPDWQTRHIYLPSTPSLITSFASALENVFTRLNEIDFEKTFTQLDSTLASIQRITDEVQAEKLNQSVVAAVNDIRQTSRQLRSVLQQVEEPNLPVQIVDTLDDIRQTSRQLRTVLQQVEDPNLPEQVAGTLARFNRSLAQVENLIATNRYDLNTMVENLRDMSEFLRDFAQSIKRDPAQLLLSSPPEETEVYQ